MTHQDIAKATLAGVFLGTCALGGWILAGLIYFPALPS